MPACAQQQEWSSYMGDLVRGGYCCRADYWLAHFVQQGEYGLTLLIVLLAQPLDPSRQRFEVDPRFQLCIIRLLFHNRFLFCTCVQSETGCRHALVSSVGTAVPSSWRRISPGVGVITFLPSVGFAQHCPHIAPTWAGSVLSTGDLQM